MSKLLEYIINVTHGCIDGTTCAFISKQAFGNRLEKIYYTDHRYVNDLVLDLMDRYHYATIILTDICLEIGTIEAIITNGDADRLIIIDHHHSAKKLDKYDMCYIYDNMCGALAYKEWLIENGLICDYTFNKYNDIFKRVNDFDLMLISDLVDEWQILWRVLGNESFIHRLVTNSNVKFNEFEKSIVSIEKRRIQKYVSDALETVKYSIDNNGNHYGYVFAENNHNEIGNAIIRGNHDIDYGVVINISSKQVSLRSRGFDVCTIAENLCKLYKTSGGGHERSASVKLNDDIVTETQNLLLAVR